MVLFNDIESIFEMDYNFNTLFDALLKLAEEHPELSPDELLSLKTEEWELDANVLSQISESEEILNEFDEKVREMKASGQSRDYFVGKELTRITEGHSEEERDVLLNAIQIVINKDVELEKLS